MWRLVPVCLALLVQVSTRAADFSLPPAIKNAFRIGTSVKSIGFDAAGNLYLTGISYGRATEVIPGAKILGPALGPQPIVVAKVSPVSHEVLYVTEIGGSSNDIPNAMAVGADGSVFLVGYTYSP